MISVLATLLLLAVVENMRYALLIMNATLKHAFFSGLLALFVFLWAGGVSASPFLMMPDMHSDGMNCVFSAPTELSCPMNLVEQVDQWSDAVAVLPLLAQALFVALGFTGVYVLAQVFRRVAVHPSPPGIVWLERIQEQWALSQGILNPKRPHMQHA